MVFEMEEASPVGAVYHSDGCQAIVSLSWFLYCIIDKTFLTMVRAPCPGTMA